MIWPPPKCNEPIWTISRPYEVPKNFEKFKQVENGKGKKIVMIPHILRTLSNFLVLLDFYFSGNDLTTS